MRWSWSALTCSCCNGQIENMLLTLIYSMCFSPPYYSCKYSPCTFADEGPSRTWSPPIRYKLLHQGIQTFFPHSVQRSKVQDKRNATFGCNDS